MLSLAEFVIHEPEEAYHARSNKGECLSSHKLAVFRKSAALYKKTIDGIVPQRKSREFDVGAAAHALILEGRKAYESRFVFDGFPINPTTGNPYGPDTAKFAAWLAKPENPGKRPIVPDDAATIEAMALSVKAHALAADLLADAGEDRAAADPVQARWYLIEFHRRFALPFACLVFTFAGLPLGVSTTRSSKSMGMILSLLLMLVYYLAFVGGTRIAGNAQFSPLLAAWLPNAVFAVLGIVLLVGGYSLTKSYYGALEEIRLGEQFHATIDRLSGGCRLSRVLSEAQDVGCTVTAQSLGELLAAAALLAEPWREIAMVALACAIPMSLTTTSGITPSGTLASRTAK